MNKIGIHSHFSIRHKKAKIPRNTANFASNILDREFTAPTPNSKYTRRFHETLEYKKPMDVYQESIKLNQEKKRAS
jgi:hypothetical protein